MRKRIYSYRVFPFCSCPFCGKGNVYYGKNKKDFKCKHLINRTEHFKKWNGECLEHKFRFVFEKV